MKVTFLKSLLLWFGFKIDPRAGGSYRTLILNLLNWPFVSGGLKGKEDHLTKKVPLSKTLTSESHLSTDWYKHRNTAVAILRFAYYEIFLAVDDG